MNRLNHPLTSTRVLASKNTASLHCSSKNNWGFNDLWFSICFPSSFLVLCKFLELWSFKAPTTCLINSFSQWYQQKFISVSIPRALSYLSALFKEWLAFQLNVREEGSFSGRHSLLHFSPCLTRERKHISLSLWEIFISYIHFSESFQFLQKEGKKSKNQIQFFIFYLRFSSV